VLIEQELSYDCCLTPFFDTHWPMDSTAGDNRRQLASRINVEFPRTEVIVDGCWWGTAAAVSA